MTVQRGNVWLANLNPTRGSEQAEIRPVLVFQNDVIKLIALPRQCWPFR